MRKSKKRIISIYVFVLATLTGCGFYESGEEIVKSEINLEQVIDVPSIDKTEIIELVPVVLEHEDLAENVFDHAINGDFDYALIKSEGEKAKAQEKSSTQPQLGNGASFKREWFCAYCDAAFPNPDDRNYHMDYTCEARKQLIEEDRRRSEAASNAREYTCPMCGANCGSINTGGGESALIQHLNDNHYGQTYLYGYGFEGEEENWRYERRTWLGSWQKEEISKEEYDRGY